MNDKEIVVIKEMLVKSHEKITAAILLYDNDIFDDSVSRAYYSSFHCISAVLFSKGFVFSSHKETIGCFNREFIRKDLFPSDFSLKIEKLFRSRQTGDYDTKQFVEKEIALERIAFAKEIYNACSTYLSEISGIEVHLLTI